MGRCSVARLQMKVGHMDGMHCFIDSTSILVKKNQSRYKIVGMCVFTNICMTYSTTSGCIRMILHQLDNNENSNQIKSFPIEVIRNCGFNPA